MHNRLDKIKMGEIKFSEDQNTSFQTMCRKYVHGETSIHTRNMPMHCGVPRWTFVPTIMFCFSSSEKGSNLNLPHSSSLMSALNFLNVTPMQQFFSLGNLRNMSFSYFSSSLQGKAHITAPALSPQADRSHHCPCSIIILNLSPDT